MESWMSSQPPYKTMFSLCRTQIISLYQSKSPVNQTSVDAICHLLTSAVYKNHTSGGVMDFQNLAPVDLAWWIDGFMSTVITLITIILNTVSIVIFTSSSLRSPTNTILAMISALDVLTCVLRAPLLIYVYLYEGYKVLPSMTWCKEYNYLHNFVPSALHSTAFLLNMGLSVQRSVGVRDIRRLRGICSYKGTIAIALVSFFMSAFIHSLYPITYQVTPVVALGKQMLASGRLQEVETCKVSPRYSDRFEDLSTSYAWARISTLQLLPGIVMCICNISLIAISYKTYNYRKRLIGAIGTIMNVNRGFERDDDDDGGGGGGGVGGYGDGLNNKDNRNAFKTQIENNNVLDTLPPKQHAETSAIFSTAFPNHEGTSQNDIGNDMMISISSDIEKDGENTSTELVGDYEFQFQLSSAVGEKRESSRSSRGERLVLSSTGLEQRLGNVCLGEDCVASCGDNCSRCVVGDEGGNGQDMFDSEESVEFTMMFNEERNVTQELDRIIDGLENGGKQNEDSVRTVKGDFVETKEWCTESVMKEEVRIPEEIYTVDLKHIDFYEPRSDNVENSNLIIPFSDTGLSFDLDSKRNSVTFTNGVYENAFEIDGHLSMRGLELNEVEDSIPIDNNCEYQNCENDTNHFRPLTRNNSLILTNERPMRDLELSENQHDKNANTLTQKDDILPSIIDNNHHKDVNGQDEEILRPLSDLEKNKNNNNKNSTNLQFGESSTNTNCSTVLPQAQNDVVSSNNNNTLSAKQQQQQHQSNSSLLYPSPDGKSSNYLLDDTNNNLPMKESSSNNLNSIVSSQEQNNNISITQMQPQQQQQQHPNTSLLHIQGSPDRNGSDISSMVSSTLVEDTMLSETWADYNTVTTTTTNTTTTSRPQKRPKRSPKRRGGDEGSVAELRPTIMLVLVTSCTLLAELMVTVAIFVNFMNQVVYKHFVAEDSLVTFILVSNLITMVSFPINFVFFCGLSRPFRNTLIAYTHFVMRKISR